MGKPNYVCSLCKKDFSRKSNANRHDLSQHQGLAQIIPVGDYKLREKGFFVKANYNSNRSFYIDPKKARLFETLEKLVPRFEEMEQALPNNNSEDKQKDLGQVIINAISSPDPIRSMNGSLDATRKGSSVPKMMNCVALSLGVTRNVAEEILASMVV
jgi:hypothetical protein